MRSRVRLRHALFLAAALVALLSGGAAPAAPGDGLRVPEDVRSISYFPARGGWTLMWTRFDADAIDRDMARIAFLRANTVRVIVPTNVFGYPEPEAAMTARLETTVDLAARHGLRVELTLFDWWHDYADVQGSRRWAAALLSRYSGDVRIAFVELKNELRPQDVGAVEWAAALIPHVREVARRPVALSVPALDAARDLRLLRAALGSAQPDFYSAHFYWRPELAAEHLDAATAAVAPLPLRVGRDRLLDRDPVRRPSRRARVAVRARGPAGVLPSLARARDAPARPASDRALDPVRLRAGRDPAGRPRRARQPAGVPLRPLPRLRRGEARSHRAADDLLGRQPGRLQRRLRRRCPGRTRSSRTRAVAHPARR